MRRELALVCLIIAAQSAHATGRLAEVLVIDRDSGTPLPTYYHHGEYWVAGKPGARYAIEIRNTLHQRLLAVTSVDGVNVLTGDTARWDQSGYVLHGGEAYEITGWRKSQAEVAAFEFAAAPNSYAARTGRSANIGVIGVAVFRERVAEPLYSAPSEPATDLPSRAAPLAGLDAPDKAAASTQESVTVTGERVSPRTRLGTGHGPREQSYVEYTDFTRSSSRPNEVVRIRYDSRENLLALGIIAPPVPAPSDPNPFPGSPLAHFVPDPP